MVRTPIRQMRNSSTRALHLKSYRAIYRLTPYFPGPTAGTLPAQHACTHVQLARVSFVSRSCRTTGIDAQGGAPKHRQDQNKNKKNISAAGANAALGRKEEEDKLFTSPRREKRQLLPPSTTSSNFRKARRSTWHAWLLSAQFIKKRCALLKSAYIAPVLTPPTLPPSLTLK